MIVADTPNPLSDAVSADPTIEVAERQLAMLGELAQMTMVLSRAHAASALAAAHAVEVILADELWQPETGRARALAGSRDAAEAFQKVSRSLRLTLAAEMKTAETLRDLRAGIVTNSNAHRQGAGGTPVASERALDLDRRRPAGSSSDDAAPDFDKPERDFERLCEIEHPDRLPGGTFREVVDRLCADLGIMPDWDSWSIGRPDLKYKPLAPTPPNRSETRPGSGPRREPFGDAADRLDHPPP